MKENQLLQMMTEINNNSNYKKNLFENQKILSARRKEGSEASNKIFNKAARLKETKNKISFNQISYRNIPHFNKISNEIEMMNSQILETFQNVSFLINLDYPKVNLQADNPL
jgi:hypothetical protein